MADANPAYYLSRVPGGAAYKLSESCRPVPIFNGVSQYATGSYQPNTTTFFIEFDIYPTTNDDIEYIAFASSNAYIRQNAGGVIRFRFLNLAAGGNQIQTSVPVPLNQWSTIRLEATPSDMNLYINGALDATVGVFSAYDLTEIFTRLASANGFGYFTGRIKNFNYNDGLVLPLDDGFANNPVASNTAGADWSFVNMTSESWGEFCE